MNPMLFEAMVVPPNGCGPTHRTWVNLSQVQWMEEHQGRIHIYLAGREGPLQVSEDCSLEQFMEYVDKMLTRQVESHALAAARAVSERSEQEMGEAFTQLASLIKGGQ